MVRLPVNSSDHMIRETSKLVSCLVSEMSRYASYRDDHTPVSRHITEALDILKTLLIEHFFTITVNDDNSMLINGVRVIPDAPEAKRFFLKLLQKGVITMIISKGVRADELRKFCADLGSSGSFFHSYPHIAIKRKVQEYGTDILRPEQSMRHNCLGIKRLYRDISAHRSVTLSTVDTVVSTIMENVRRGSHPFGLLIPTRGESDDLYIHSSNVAMLSIAQGERLGFGNALLYDLGFAALLHDVGKVLLPTIILENQDELTEAEWAVMKKHPVHGASLLASLKMIPEIAVVVAYEHHMRFDGTGYPETPRRTKKQHIISQIVAIADFYCAVSADLSHRKPLSTASIMRLLRERAGSEFNPLLVDSFDRVSEGFSSRPS